MNNIRINNFNDRLWLARIQFNNIVQGVCLWARGAHIIRLLCGRLIKKKNKSPLKKRSKVFRHLMITQSTRSVCHTISLSSLNYAVHPERECHSVYQYERNASRFDLTPTERVNTPGTCCSARIMIITRILLNLSGTKLSKLCGSRILLTFKNYCYCYFLNCSVYCKMYMYRYIL